MWQASDTHTPPTSSDWDWKVVVGVEDNSSASPIINKKTTTSNWGRSMERKVAAAEEGLFSLHWLIEKMIIVIVKIENKFKVILIKTYILLLCHSLNTGENCRQTVSHSFKV